MITDYHVLNLVPQTSNPLKIVHPEKISVPSDCFYKICFHPVSSRLATTVTNMQAPKWPNHASCFLILHLLFGSMAVLLPSPTLQKEGKKLEHALPRLPPA